MFRAVSSSFRERTRMSDFTLSTDHPATGVRRIRWMRPGRLEAPAWKRPGCLETPRPLGSARLEAPGPPNVRELSTEV